MQSSIIEQGIKQGLIKLSEDGKQITYLNQNKNRNFTNPEEYVQAETYLKLILEKGYKPERIRQFEPVKMGSENREADIVVYHDDECKQPHILVECKKQEVSEPEFLQAVEQAYSYAYALPNNVKYVWVTPRSEVKYNFPINLGVPSIYQSAYTHISFPLCCFITNYSNSGFSESPLSIT